MRKLRIKGACAQDTKPAPGGAGRCPLLSVSSCPVPLLTCSQASDPLAWGQHPGAFQPCVLMGTSGLKEAGAVGSSLWQSCDLGELLVVRVAGRGLGPAATEALKAPRATSGAAQGPATLPVLPGLTVPPLSQDLVVCSCMLSGITGPGGGNSPSPTKEQREYLITGGCCHLQSLKPGPGTSCLLLRVLGGLSFMSTAPA